MFTLEGNGKKKKKNGKKKKKKIKKQLIFQSSISEVLQ